MNSYFPTIATGLGKEGNKNLLDFVSAEIVSAIEKLDLSLESDYTLTEIPHLLNNTVLKGGKRFRPLICFLMGEVFLIPLNKIAPYARIAELTHSATLVHDDVIDNSDRRRDQKTLNVLTTNARAVLAGDLLLTRAISELCKLKTHNIMQYLTFVLQQLVDGEWIQLNVQGDLRASCEQLDVIAAKKTSSLFSWCCSVPAFLSGANEEIITECKNFGITLGQIFQKIDDILDFEHTSNKPFALDLKNGQVNSVTMELLNANPDMFNKLESLLVNFEPNNWPWTDEELKRAKDQIRYTVKSLVIIGKSQLQKIVSFLNQNTTQKSSTDLKSTEKQSKTTAKQSAAIKTLEMVLDYLVDRQK